MANEKQINSRIQHKHDTEANWYTAGTATNPFIPKVGELIIYDPDDIYGVRTKIGNGETPVHLLPWARGCDESVGLAYTLNSDGLSYSVKKGTCTDTDIVIPSTYNGLPVTSIGNYAFSDCTSLTSIEIPDSVTSIGSCAFCDCTLLTSIVIPDSVTSIGRDAFSGCSLLTGIEIPDSVTSIGYGAFYGCSSLTIYCEATSKPNGWSSSWNPSGRPIVWGFANDFIAVNEAINGVNSKIGDINIVLDSLIHTTNITINGGGYTGQ